MLEHAVHAELGNLVGINLTESTDSCQLIVDQCIALADCILDRRSAPAWAPSEKVIRVFANLTVRGLENSVEKIAHTGLPAATSDAVYTYLARMVVDGEPAADSPAIPNARVVPPRPHRHLASARNPIRESTSA